MFSSNYIMWRGLEWLYIIRKHCLQISKYCQCMSISVANRYFYTHTHIIWIWFQYDSLIMSYPFNTKKHVIGASGGGAIGGNTLLFMTELPPQILHQLPAHSLHLCSCWSPPIPTCNSAPKSHLGCSHLGILLGACCCRFKALAIL